jgi:hypothetical protein
MFSTFLFSLRCKRTRKKKVTNCSCLLLLSWAHDCNSQVPLGFTIDIRQVASIEKVLQMSRNRAVTRSKAIGAPMVVFSRYWSILVSCCHFVPICCLFWSFNLMFQHYEIFKLNLTLLQWYYWRCTTAHMGIWEGCTNIWRQVASLSDFIQCGGVYYLWTSVWNLLFSLLAPRNPEVVARFLGCLTQNIEALWSF